MQQRATRCLYTIAEEQATRSAAISSTHAQMMLTDLLFMALVQQDLERASERIRHSEALVKTGLKMALPPHAEELSSLLRFFSVNQLRQECVNRYGNIVLSADSRNRTI